MQNISKSTRSVCVDDDPFDRYFLISLTSTPFPFIPVAESKFNENYNCLSQIALCVPIENSFIRLFSIFLKIQRSKKYLHF